MPQSLSDAGPSICDRLVHFFDRRRVLPSGFDDPLDRPEILVEGPKGHMAGAANDEIDSIAWHKLKQVADLLGHRDPAVTRESADRHVGSIPILAAHSCHSSLSAVRPGVAAL